MAADRIVRSTSVALAPADDGHLAWDRAAARLHRLHPAVALILKLSDGTRSSAELCAELAAVLDGDGREGCARWIEFARAEGLLQSLPLDAPLPTRPAPQELIDYARELRRDGLHLAAFVCQYEAALQLPDDATAWYELGELAYFLGRRQDSREAYERYAALQPEDAAIAHILVALRDEAPPPRTPDPCIEQIFDGFAASFERVLVDDLKYQGPERIAEALEAVLGSAADLEVLELGCGTGLTGRRLRPRARHLTGIDLSAEMLLHARVTGLYDQLERAEITEWLQSAAPDAFDLIVACDTLSYFGDLRQVLLPAAALLHRGPSGADSGGWLVFTVEHSEAAPFRLTDSGRYAHSEAHVRAAALEAGLTVVRLSEGFLRCELGEPVMSLVAVLRGRSGSAACSAGVA